jgi:hypothetical protein
MDRGNRRRSSIAAVTLVLGVSALVAGGALARASFSTTVTLDAVSVSPHSVSYGGHVSSEKAKCVKGRDVSVHEMKGDEPAMHDPLVGRAASDESGKYDVTGHHPPADGDKFYADVAKRKFGRKGHKKTCDAAQSDIFEY